MRIKINLLVFACNMVANLLAAILSLCTCRREREGWKTAKKKKKGIDCSERERERRVTF